MAERTPQDWETLERELHAAGVSAQEVDAGAQTLLAQTRGHQLAQTRCADRGSMRRSRSLWASAGWKSTSI
jgi:hypothetical protein